MLIERVIDSLKVFVGRLVRTIGFIIGLGLITNSFNYAFTKTAMASADMWKRYSKESDINLLITGSSVGWSAVPGVIETIDDVNAFNMSTPSQYFNTSEYGIRLATSQHPINTVILMMGFEGLKYDEDYAADRAFKETLFETSHPIVREYECMIDKAGRLTDYDFAKKTDSMNLWFDWVNNFSYSFDEIDNNVKTRDHYVPDYKIDPLVKKYERDDSENDDLEEDELQDDIAIIKNMNVQSFDLCSNSLITLDNMANYTEKNGIRFVVVVAPHRSDYKLQFGNDYDRIDAYLKMFIEDRGGEYYNLDADPELREVLDDSYFDDVEHMNDSGNMLTAYAIVEALKREHD